MVWAYSKPGLSRCWVPKSVAKLSSLSHSTAVCSGGFVAPFCDTLQTFEAKLTPSHCFSNL